DVVVLAMFLDNVLRENSQALDSLVHARSIKVRARPFLDPEVSEPDWRVTQVDFQGALHRYEVHRRQQAEPLNRLLRHSALLQLGQRALRLLRLPWPGAKGSARSNKATSLETEYLAQFGEAYCDQPP